MKMRRFDFYPDDWLQGTSKLDAVEVGVYITVCALNYSEGGPIERDDRDLARRLRLRTPHVTRIVDALKTKRKLIEDELGLYCRRCLDEIERSHKRHVDASKAIAKRWNTNGLDDTPVSNGVSLNGNTYNHHTTNSRREGKEYGIDSESLYQQKESSKPRAHTRARNGLFEEWWEGFPEKVGKAHARKAFEKALAKTSFDQLIAGVERYKASKPHDRAWCHPATWLNQERWLDQPTPPLISELKFDPYLPPSVGGG